MTISQRIVHHREEIAKLQKHHAARLECVSQDLQHRRNMVDADMLKSHARVLAKFEDSIAIERAVLAELEMLEILGGAA